MKSVKKFHAIKVDVQKCFGCTHCMKACPTEAIRIKNGVATINEARCIDCGNCLRACPVNAFYVEQDGLVQTKDFTYRVLLFPAVLVGQFPEMYSEGMIYEALLNLGFTHVYEVEQPIGQLIKGMKEQVNNSLHLPLISSFCPAVVRLIQCKYPSLVENIMPLKVPHDLAAHFVLNRFERDGIKREEIGIFYVSPCSAKMAAVKSPVGEEKSIVDGVINMGELYNLIMRVISKTEKRSSSEFRKYLSRDGIVWSLPRGETRHFPSKAISIDGIHNVVKFLERLENDDVPELDFIELKSCSQGCAGGILMNGNRFLTAERLQKRSKRYPFASLYNLEKKEDAYIQDKLKLQKFDSNFAFQLDTDKTKALEKIQKAENILCQLPGIDCGACGAPNCHALAEDMVQQQAKMSDCVFLQNRFVNEKKVNPQKAFKTIENKWGINRFNADCNKKGRRNEGF